MKNTTIERYENQETKATMLTQLVKVIYYIRKNTKNGKRIHRKEIEETLKINQNTLRYYIATIKKMNIGLESYIGNKSMAGYYIPELLTEEEENSLKKLDKELYQKINKLLERVI